MLQGIALLGLGVLSITLWIVDKTLGIIALIGIGILVALVLRVMHLV